MRAATGLEAKKRAWSSLDHHSYFLSPGKFCLQRIFWGGNLKCLVWEMGQANCSGLLSSEKTGTATQTVGRASEIIGSK